MKEIIISFDPASTRNLGYSLASYDNGEYSYIESGTHVFEKDISSPIRLLDCYDFVKQLLLQVAMTDSEFSVILEGSVGFGFAVARANLNELVGVVKLVSKQVSDIECIAIYPTAWKKLVMGTGKAESKNVKKRIEEEFGIKLATLHEADAIAIGIAYCIKKHGMKWYAPIFEKKKAKKKKILGGMV